MTVFAIGGKIEQSELDKIRASVPNFLPDGKRMAGNYPQVGVSGDPVGIRVRRFAVVDSRSRVAYSATNYEVKE